MSKIITMKDGSVRVIRKVEKDDMYEFFGYYKGHSIDISLYEPRPEEFVIQVKDHRGCYAVDGIEEFEVIEQAIAFAIEGAML